MSRTPTRAVIVKAGLAVAFLGAFALTRLVSLDRDLPPWELAQYQPIDEVAYTVPAFNLVHYGAWAHRAAPYAPVEGSPMNVVQSIGAALTLEIDWSYPAFRASSVLFALVAALAMLAVVRDIGRRMRTERLQLPCDPRLLIVAAALLLLFDFSFLLSGRVVEATIARLAVIAGLVWLVARGTFLDARLSLGRSFAFGLLAGAAVWFVYVYNAFLIPGAVLAVAWAVASRTRRPGDVLRHVAAASLGVAVATAAYFGLVYVVYGFGPTQWYDTWVALYRETGRAVGFSLTRISTIAGGNIFGLDRAFMAVAVLGAPSFVRWTWRTAAPVGIATLSLLVAFVAQCTIQSDYPQRKMLVLLALVLPMAVGGILALPEYLEWAKGRRWRVVFAAGWAGATALGTAALVLPTSWTHLAGIARRLHIAITAIAPYRTGPFAELVAICALGGLAAAFIAAAAIHRRTAFRLAGAALLVTILAPAIALDRAYVYDNVTTTYRDAMISARPDVDGRVTAGSLSFAMQLYNTSRPVLNGYYFGITAAEYDAALVRFFREGNATTMFGYADPDQRTHWASLGFTLAEAYPIVGLPKNRTIGRYVFTGG